MPNRSESIFNCELENGQRANRQPIERQICTMGRNFSITAVVKQTQNIAAIIYTSQMQ